MPTPLILSARSNGRNAKHARIAIWQQGALAGVITVEADQEGSVLTAINQCSELLCAVRGFIANYPGGLNPGLDEAYRMALAAVARPGRG